MPSHQDIEGACAVIIYTKRSRLRRLIDWLFHRDRMSTKKGYK